MNQIQFLSKLKTSNRKLFKSHCIELIKRNNIELKKQLKLERKKIKKTKSKIALKYKNLHVKINGLNIDYRMYKKLLNSIIDRKKIKTEYKDIDYHKLCFTSLDFNVDQLKKDIVKYYTPLAK